MHFKRYDSAVTAAAVHRAGGIDAEGHVVPVRPRFTASEIMRCSYSALQRTERRFRRLAPLGADPREHGLTSHMARKESAVAAQHRVDRQRAWRESVGPPPDDHLQGSNRAVNRVPARALFQLVRVRLIVKSRRGGIAFHRMHARRNAANHFFVGGWASRQAHFIERLQQLIRVSQRERAQLACGLRDKTPA